MKNLIDKYKIHRDLLMLDSNQFNNLYKSKLKSTIEDVKNAIKLIVPISSGHDLIRLGGKGDGGYLIPKDLKGIDSCFSPGVNNIKKFEDQLAEEYSIKSYMCDFTSDVSKFQTPLISGMQFFEKKWLDVKPNDDNLDINHWILSNSSNQSELILQMDIEGAEYRNILHINQENFHKFRIIVIELHGLDSLNEYNFLHGIFLPTINKIVKNYTCVHAHPNNCSKPITYSDNLKIPPIIELTFLRNDRFKFDIHTRPSLLSIPHHLDDSNVKNNQPIHLDGIWLSNADPVQSEMNALRKSMAWYEKNVKMITNEKQRIMPNENFDPIFNMIENISQTQANIAMHKVATQSSLSKYSTSEGANGAINGKKTGRFGIHTNIELNPWWSVNLGDVFEITSLIIFNRLDAGFDRANKLIVICSLDLENWELVYDHHGKPPFGGVKPLYGRPPLLIIPKYSKKIHARFIKILCVTKTILHLDEVEIYGNLKS